MKDCIFCKIVKWDIPSFTIYEDDIIKVFLDVNPATNGHMLIIPKNHYENLFTIDEDVITHSLKVIKDILYPLIKEKLNCDGLTISQNNGFGQEVKHFHIHLIPRYENDKDTHTYNKDIMLSVDDIYTKLKNV